MKRFQRVVLFADADELDRLTCDLPNRERRAATRIAIHLGEDDAGQRELLVELVGGFNRVLASHRVGDEQYLLRIERPPERLHLFHELVVDVETASGVDDEDVTTGVNGFLTGFFGESLY